MNPLHSQFSMGMKKKYQTKGLYVIGIHSPESEREKERTHVMKAVKRYHVDYSIMMDNDLRYWNALGTTYWPYFYLFNKQGDLVLDSLGTMREGDNSATRFETMIQELLAQ